MLCRMSCQSSVTTKSDPGSSMRQRHNIFGGLDSVWSSACPSNGTIYRIEISPGQYVTRGLGQRADGLGSSKGEGGGGSVGERKAREGTA